jgi:putative transposase
MGRSGRVRGRVEAYVHDVSTRNINDSVNTLDTDTGISKSAVSRICSVLDEDVALFPGPVPDGHRVPIPCFP